MTTEYLPQDTTSTEQDFAVLLIKLGGRQFGLPLGSVERVMPMAHVLSLPDGDDTLLGVLNLHGEVLPVINAHPRLGLATPKITAEQRLVLLRASVPFLMWVDDVEKVVVSAADALSVIPAHQASALVWRVLRLGDNIVPVLAPAALEPRGSVR